MQKSHHKFTLPEAIKLQALVLDMKDINCQFSIKHGLQVFSIKSNKFNDEKFLPEQFLSFTKHSNSFYAMNYTNYQNEGSEEVVKVCKNIEECLKQIIFLLNEK